MKKEENFRKNKNKTRKEKEKERQKGRSEHQSKGLYKKQKTYQ